MSFGGTGPLGVAPVGVSKWVCGVFLCVSILLLWLESLSCVFWLCATEQMDRVFGLPSSVGAMGVFAVGVGAGVVLSDSLALPPSSSAQCWVGLSLIMAVGALPCSGRALFGGLQ